MSLLIMIGVGGLVFLYSSVAQRPARGPYSAQFGSPVRGLSQDEIDSLLEGRGAGLARTAELNGYPGPLHVLELQKQLDLSAQQKTTVEAARARMLDEAKRLGREILNREKVLSEAFDAATITNRELDTRITELGRLYAELRVTHLRAHVAIRPILTAEQVAHYDRLRGYTAPTHQPRRH